MMETTNRLATLELISARSFGKPRKRPRHGKGRQLWVEKSNNFIKLPMDLVFEISVELHPLDLLRLSRVSKLFRSIYMSRQAQAIWRATLKRIVPEPPPCAPDLNEAQYASLLFESSCWACASGGVENDYGLRLKLCTRCWNKNIVYGSSLRSLFKKLPNVVFSLVPRHLTHQGQIHVVGSHTPQCDCNSNHNNSSHQYCKAELEMAADQYVSLRHQKKLLEAFIGERQQRSSDMMQHGCKLYSWEVSFKRHQAELASERKASITEKLDKAGWPPACFPIERDGADLETWVRLVNQPKPLTVESWHALFPKLNHVLLQVKDKRRSRLLDKRLRNEYSIFLGRRAPLDRAAMPHWPDARVLPSIADFLSRYRGNMDEPRAFWDSLFDKVVTEAKPYSISVKKVLIRLLKRASPRPFPSSGNPDDVLKFPSSVFQCINARCSHSRSSSPSAQLFNYPEILTHSYCHLSSWSSDWVGCDPGLTKTVFLMLNALNLPVDVSKRTIQSLDEKLMCLCGNPRRLKPTSFRKLVKHVVDENHHFNELRKGAMALRANSVTQVFNDHNMEGVNPVIAIVSPDLRAPSAVRAISGNKETGYLREFFIDHGNFGYCGACYRLSRHLTKFSTEADLRYHIKAKHHIGVLKKAHFDTKGQLASRYDVT